MSALHDKHERSTTTMSERRNTQASHPGNSLTERDARIEKTKRVGKFIGSTLGILAIPGVPIAAITGVRHEQEKNVQIEECTDTEV